MKHLMSGWRSVSLGLVFVAIVAVSFWKIALRIVIDKLCARLYQ